MLLPLVLLFTCAALADARAQQATLRDAPAVFMPGEIDGNSPSFWYQDRLRLFTSIGRPIRINEADSQFGEWASADAEVGDMRDLAIWIEAAWVDDNGVVLGWYHHEPGGLFDDWTLTAPKIGAVISFDGGQTIHDLGIVLESGDPLDADARNGAFAGGHGDFSVVLDRQRQYFYFVFTNYGGPEDTQGIVMARMAFEDRFAPAGRVFKYHRGEWNEPGLGGQVSAIFPATRAWHHPDPDSFWGPAVHWNTHLNSYVMLLNRAAVKGWRQEGIYVSFARDLGNPESWQTPVKILSRDAFRHWGTHYPQVIGIEAGETDTIAGRVARMYVSGGSEWEIVFSTNQERPTAPAGRPSR